MFNGIYTPVVTPFDDSEGIDFQKMKHNLDRWGETPLDGIVVLGSNGEFVYLSETERLQVVQFAVSHFTKAKKIIAGASCESTKETAATAKRMAELGVDAVLLLPPHYYRGAMTDDILYRHFMEAADACPVPVMLYNMPGNTGINLSSALIARLAKHPNIAGVKDTGGNIVQISEIVRDTSDDFAVFAGNTGYLLPALAVGARGATLALANILPEECCRIVTLARGGRWDEARELQLKLLRINAMVTAKFGVAGLKAALDMLGYEGGSPRRPLRPADDDVKSAIRAELQQIGAL